MSSGLFFFLDDANSLEIGGGDGSISLRFIKANE